MSVPYGAQPQQPLAATATDPHGIAPCFARLANNARKSVRQAALIAASHLEAGEVVEAIVGGRVSGHPAVVVITDRCVLVADEREWKPQVSRLSLDAELRVQGWQDDRTASLTFGIGSQELVVDQIVDRPLAVEMAQRIRYRTGNAG